MSYDFADRLIEMRRARGLSQEELASKLGLSRQAISKWERAESSPDIGNLVALADIYGVTLDELVRKNNEETVSDEAVIATTVEDDALLAQEACVDVEPSISTASESSQGAFPPPEFGAIPVHEAAEPHASTIVTPQLSNPIEQQKPAPAPTPAPAPAPKAARGPMFTFPYPILVVLVYLILGFCFQLWHPGWIIFFTIPFYYWIANVVAHDPEYVARHSMKVE